MTFRNNFPFDFKLLNDNNTNVFFLEDKADAVTLEITNESGMEVAIPRSAAGEPGKDNYHFALRFRPGTLIIPANVKPSIFGSWTISAPKAEDGFGLLYFVYNSATGLPDQELRIAAGASIVIKFNLDVDGTPGSRITNVELTNGAQFGAVNGASGVMPMGALTRTMSWTLTNHRGKAYLPLQINFMDSDTVLNTGVPNELSFRIVNLQKDETGRKNFIQFNNDPKAGPVSRISMFFDADDTSFPTALASCAAVSNIGISHFTTNNESLLTPLPRNSSAAMPLWQFVLSPTIDSLNLLPIINRISETEIKQSELSQADVISPFTGIATMESVIGQNVSVGTVLCTMQVSHEMKAPVAGVFDSIVAYGFSVEVGQIIGYMETLDYSQVKRVVVAERSGQIVGMVGPLAIVDEGAVLCSFRAVTERIISPINGIFTAGNLTKMPGVNFEIKLGDKIGTVEHPSVTNERHKDLTFIDFSLENIITNYPTGKTRLNIRFENIPGYWDETFSLIIEKQPLVMRGNNVGINATTPLAELHVEVNTPRALSIPLLLKNRSSDDGLGSSVGIGFLNEMDPKGNWTKAAIVHERVFAYGVGDLKFLVNDDTSPSEVKMGDAKMTIQHTGNIGIGTTAPEAKLHISEDLRVDKLLITGKVVPPVSGRLIFYTDGSGLQFRIASQGKNVPAEDLITITDKGNVGIGTTSPVNKLQLGGNIHMSGNAIYINAAPSNLDNYIQYDQQNKTTDIGGKTGVRLVSWVDGQYISPVLNVINGKVGIGITDPKFQLELGGNMHMNGFNILLRPQTLGNQFGGIKYNASKDTVDIGGYNGVTLGYTATEGNIRPMINITKDYVGIGYDNLGGQINQVLCVKQQYVGIGVTDPKCLLHLGTGSKLSYIDRNGNNDTYDDEPISLLSLGYIVAYLGIKNRSDARAKTGFTSSDVNNALSNINKLRVTDYRMIEDEGRSPKTSKGLIAQEVEAVFPEAVSKMTNFVPSIYALPEKVTLHHNELHITLHKAHELSSGDTVRLIAGEEGNKDVVITVIDDHSFRVADWSGSLENLFVFGKQVDDFRLLEYNHIFMAGIGAIQALSRQVDGLQARLQVLESPIPSPSIN